MKPILFNTEMVRAIFDDRKWATRRVMKGLSGDAKFLEMEQNPSSVATTKDGEELPKILDGLFASFVQDGLPKYPLIKAPYQPGDILYVRETWCNINKPGIEPDYYYFADTKDWEDYDPSEWTWRPSIHMPKEAARLFLRVTDVRVERLRDITEEQAKGEGARRARCSEPSDCGEFSIAYDSQGTHIGGFAVLWNSTIKPADLDLYGWEANPWVWVIEFERVSKEEV